MAENSHYRRQFSFGSREQSSAKGILAASLRLIFLSTRAPLWPVQTPLPYPKILRPGNVEGTPASPPLSKQQNDLSSYLHSKGRKNQDRKKIRHVHSENASSTLSLLAQRTKSSQSSVSICLRSSVSSFAAVISPHLLLNIFPWHSRSVLAAAAVAVLDEDIPVNAAMVELE